MNTIPTSLPFQPYLMSGERILWFGQPKQGLALSAKDALLIPFSLMWGGFAIFWNAMLWLEPFGSNSPSDSDWFFRLWGLPFLAMGIYLIVGRFIHDAHIRKTTHYAVSDQRIMKLRGSKITSLDIHRLPCLEFSQGRDGTGTLAFEPSSIMSWGGMNGLSWWVPSSGTTMQFFRVQNAQTVYELVQTQARS